MSTAIIEYEPDLLWSISLDSERADTSCALYLGDITVNWGRLEYGLYLILEAIDPNECANWTEVFTNARTTKARREVVRAQVFAAVADEGLRQQLDEVLARLERLCLERNPLAHWVWRRIEAGRYELVPLQRDGKAPTLKQRKVVTLDELRNVARELDYVRQHLASLATEFMAYRELRRTDERRRVAADLQRQEPTRPN